VKLLNPWELLLIVFVLVLIFGSKRLPGMGRSMGGAIKGFKDSVTERTEKHDAEHEQEQVAQQQAQAQLPPAQPVAAPPEPVAAEPQVDPRERDTVV
jgi:sec-independent protein translocase protein TatA